MQKAVIIDFCFPKSLANVKITQPIRTIKQIIEDIYEEINQHVLAIDLERVVVVYPNQFVDYEVYIRRLRAIETLLSDEKFGNKNCFKYDEQ